MRFSAVFAVLMILASPSFGQDRVVPGSEAEIRLSFAPVVKRVAPAVVNISTTRVVEQRGSPFFNDPFFRRFFGNSLPFQVPEQRRRRIQNSLGSGVIVQADGIVMTNHHVIRGADEIQVELSDRRVYAAEVVGSDESTDLAVLRLLDLPEDVPSVAISQSDDLEVGDLVLAIGNPFGVGQTVTSGIVSALARSDIGYSDFTSFIQTDAAINPGNSGGALVTADGRLVGINTAIYSRDGGNVGIGFAIPSAMVRVVLGGILAEGRPVRPWFGAQVQDITPDIAESLGLDRPRGVLVNQVSDGSPASEAGLAVGDVILSVEERDVLDDDFLRYQFATLPVDGEARLGVLKDGDEATLRVALIPPPDDPPRDETVLEGNHPFNGVTAANLNPALSVELNLPWVDETVVLTDIPRTVWAARRFQPGDAVVEINDEPITSVSALEDAVTNGDTSWSILYRRNGRLLTLQVSG